MDLCQVYKTARSSLIFCPVLSYASSKPIGVMVLAASDWFIGE